MNADPTIREATNHLELSETARLETFSDGVFAIAITLLILEIKVPAAQAIGGADGNGDALWHALGALWPSYLGYSASFLTLGIMWMNHHAMFRHIRKTDHWFLLANVVFLMGISFLPFPTAVLAEHLAEPNSRRTAALFYGGPLVLMSVLFNILWWAGTRDDHLLGPEASRATITAITTRAQFGALAYVVATGLALVNVWAGVCVYIALAMLFALPYVPNTKLMSSQK